MVRGSFKIKKGGTNIQYFLRDSVFAPLGLKFCILGLIGPTFGLICPTFEGVGIFEGVWLFRNFFC